MSDNTGTRQNNAVDVLLWVVLTITAVANATTSAMGLNPAVSVTFGAVTLACGVGLVVRYRRNRYK